MRDGPSRFLQKSAWTAVFLRTEKKRSLFSRSAPVHDGPFVVSLIHSCLKFVLAWAEIHKDELMQDWALAGENLPLNKIAPLM